MYTPTAPHKIAHTKYKILLVEDNPHVLELTHEILADEGYQVTTAINGEAAIETLYTRGFDLVITDLNMGQANGISVLKKTKELHPATKVIIMTGNADVRFATQAMQLNADDYVVKPFKIDDLLTRVSHCIGKPSSLGLYYSEHTEIT